MTRLTPAMAKRGWVLRGATIDSKPALGHEPIHSAPIFVRGARRQDDAVAYKHGFVYAETEADALEYDYHHFNLGEP